MSLHQFRKVLIAVLAFVVTASIAALPAFGADRKVERRVAPDYPELAKRMHIEGTVRVQVTVAPDGSVTQARTLSGNRMLAPAAADAIKKWRFEPGAATSTENIAIDFEVND